MTGHRVVDAGRDAHVGEMLSEALPMRRPQHREMVAVQRAWGLLLERDRQTAKRRLVRARDAASVLNPAVKSLQLGRENRRLDSVEARVPPADLVAIARRRRPPMVAETAHSLGQGAVLRD